ncbi:hypothetical protein [[Eubacterium] cellulosolvens]
MIASFILIAASLLGILIPSISIIELFLFAELISIASIYIFLSILIPMLFPLRSDPESIFIGGVGKPPYISVDQMYSPSVPIFEGKIKED